MTEQEYSEAMEELNTWYENALFDLECEYQDREAEIKDRLLLGD